MASGCNHNLLAVILLIGDEIVDVGIDCLEIWNLVETEIDHVVVAQELCDGIEAAFAKLGSEFAQLPKTTRAQVDGCFGTFNRGVPGGLQKFFVGINQALSSGLRFLG